MNGTRRLGRGRGGGALAACVLLAGCQEPLTGTVQVTMRVTDSITGEPIADAEVVFLAVADLKGLTPEEQLGHAGEAAGTTDDSGEFAVAVRWVADAVPPYVPTSPRIEDSIWIVGIERESGRDTIVIAPSDDVGLEENELPPVGAHEEGVSEITTVTVTGTVDDFLN